MVVLVGLDDSDPAWAALEYALEHKPDAELHLVHVVNPADTAYGEYAQFGIDGLLEERRERAERLFDRARSEAGDRADRIETETRVGLPAREIVDYAAEVDATHVVVGSHGRSGVSRILLGSVAEDVARRSPVPVTVVR